MGMTLFFSTTTTITDAPSTPACYASTVSSGTPPSGRFSRHTGDGSSLEQVLNQAC